MPTEQQLQELIDECAWRWTTQNGVAGCKVTGPNGNNIFLPAAGSYDDGHLFDVGTGGYYWSSTLDTLNYALNIYFDSSVVHMFLKYRSYGQSVRLVQNK